MVVGNLQVWGDKREIGLPEVASSKDFDVTRYPVSYIVEGSAKRVGLWNSMMEINLTSSFFMMRERASSS